MNGTVLAPLEPETAASDCFPDRSKIDDSLNISMSVDVDADARRLFQALTMPEYIEAWIKIPDNSNDSMTFAAPEANGYRLDHYAGGRKAVSINSSFLFCHQRKMRMSWRKTHEQFRADSVVDFRLRGNFGSSVLELRHLALPTADEHRWHQRLWLGSLAKLTSLLRSA
jgi:uncharacterized protein YndB with AHSA1/START domain